MSVHTQLPSLATTVSETVVVAVDVDVDVVVMLLTGRVRAKLWARNWPLV